MNKELALKEFEKLLRQLNLEHTQYQEIIKAFCKVIGY